MQAYPPKRSSSRRNRSERTASIRACTGGWKKVPFGITKSTRSRANGRPRGSGRLPRRGSRPRRRPPRGGPAAPRPVSPHLLTVTHDPRPLDPGRGQRLVGEGPGRRAGLTVHETKAAAEPGRSRLESSAERPSKPRGRALGRTRRPPPWASRQVARDVREVRLPGRGQDVGEAARSARPCPRAPRPPRLPRVAMNSSGVRPGHGARPGASRARGHCSRLGRERGATGESELQDRTASAGHP